MPRVATIVPAENDLLCEACGYTLNGLEITGRCPECGKPIEQSLGHHRAISRFETASTIGSFVITTLAVLFRPATFYSALATRRATIAASVFAHIHRAIGALLFGLAAFGHLLWVLNNAFVNVNEFSAWSFVLMLVSCLIVAYGLLAGISALTTWLSAIEARYWGMRLPSATVKRGLQFHSATYLPVGILAVVVVWGYKSLLWQGIVTYTSETRYLYTLCIAVVLSAGYLFRMYWIAMRNMMYANR